LYFKANDIAEDKRFPVLLTVIGTKNYKLLQSLVTPDPPVLNPMTNWLLHFRPKSLVIAERLRFYQRCQKPGESVADFMADLQL